jgi:hypothetical protein
VFRSVDQMNAYVPSGERLDGANVKARRPAIFHGRSSGVALGGTPAAWPSFPVREWREVKQQ